MLVTFPSLNDPAASVAVNSDLVASVEAVPVQLLPVGVPAGTRIHTASGADVGEPPYVDVVGTVPATIAALGGTSSASFGAFFSSNLGPDFGTVSIVPVPVAPGLVSPTLDAGTYRVEWCGTLAVDTPGAIGVNFEVQIAAPAPGTINGSPMFAPAGSFTSTAPAQRVSGFADLVLPAGVASVLFFVSVQGGTGVETAFLYAPTLSIYRVGP